MIKMIIKKDNKQVITYTLPESLDNTSTKDSSYIINRILSVVTSLVDRMVRAEEQFKKGFERAQEDLKKDARS